MKSGVYRYTYMDRVIYGSPLAEVLGAEVDRLEARAVYVLASGSLARDVIAEHAMHDRWVHANPRKIDGPATVRTLLDAACRPEPLSALHSATYFRVRGGVLERLETSISLSALVSTADTGRTCRQVRHVPTTDIRT